MAELKSLAKTIELPEGVTVSINGNAITAKGSKGELTRTFNLKGLIVESANNSVTITPEVNRKSQKKFVNTIEAHVKNMIEGVQTGFEYKLEAVNKHFPMNIEVKGNKVSVKNFLGEKVPRTCEVVEGVDVKLDGQTFVLTGMDKEKVGTMATRLEQMCRVTNRDRRVFQDGIFLTQKHKKAI